MNKQMIEITCPRCGKKFRWEKPDTAAEFIKCCPFCGAKCRIAPKNNLGKNNFSQNDTDGNKSPAWYGKFVKYSRAKIRDLKAWAVVWFKKPSHVVLAIVAALLIISVASCMHSCGSSNDDDRPVPVFVPYSEMTPSPTPAPTPAPTATPTPAPTSAPIPAEQIPTELEYEIYDRVQTLLWEEMPDEDDESVIMAKAAEEFGMTPDEIQDIWVKVAVYKTAVAKERENDYTLLYGELKDLTINAVNNVIVVNVKLTLPSNDARDIQKNYDNVVDLIVNQGVAEFDRLDYWAVADMTDGSESKYISFSIKQNVMKLFEDGTLDGSYLKYYVDDLWLLPSLR